MTYYRKVIEWLTAPQPFTRLDTLVIFLLALAIIL